MYIDLNITKMKTNSEEIIPSLCVVFEVDRVDFTVASVVVGLVVVVEVVVVVVVVTQPTS